MSTHRHRRFDRRIAEQLLRDAQSPGRPAAPDALGELLHAAAGPAREGELAGEQAAVAAFRAARLAPAPLPRRRTMIKTTLAGMMAAKILAPVAAAAAVGGITVAGVTGTLPLPEDTPANPPAQQPTTTPRSVIPTQDNAATPAAPNPSLTGLCQAYTSGVATAEGKAMDSPAFQVLIAKAGGEDKVTGYCAHRLADRSGAPQSVPSTGPTTPPHPTGRPSELPGVPDEDRPDRSTHPTGPPTSKPAHPIGSPTAMPPAGP